MKKIWFAIAALLLLLLSPFPASATKLPEFTGTTANAWINSPPLKLKDLEGQVVIIEVWSST